MKKIISRNVPILIILYVIVALGVVGTMKYNDLCEIKECIE